MAAMQKCSQSTQAGEQQEVGVCAAAALRCACQACCRSSAQALEKEFPWQKDGEHLTRMVV